MSSSDSDADGAQLAVLMRRSAPKAPAANGAVAPPSCSLQHLPSASDDSGLDEVEALGVLDDNAVKAVFKGRDAAEATGAHDGRGRYNRKGEGVKKRLPHAEYAWQHRELVTQNKMGVSCTASCAFGMKCWLNISPGVLLAAHEHVYGVNTSVAEATLPLLKVTYHCGVKQAEAQQTMRNLMLSWISHSTDEPPQPVEMYTVEGRGPVCASFACAAYDMDRVWKGYHADAMIGVLRADAQALHALPATLNQITGQRGSQSKFETVQWWRQWLYLEDQMPNEPTIIHRIVVWRSVYDEEYTPDMEWWGSAQPLSYPRWLVLQVDALVELAVDFYGDVASAKEDDVRLSQEQQLLKLSGGGFGVPVCTLSLRKRAKHSNFAACDACTLAKNKWAIYRKDPNRKLGDAAAIKREVFQHVHLVKLERQRAQEFHYICSQRAGVVTVLSSLDFDQTACENHCSLGISLNSIMFHMIHVHC